MVPDGVYLVFPLPKLQCPHTGMVSTAEIDRLGKAIETGILDSLHREVLAGLQKRWLALQQDIEQELIKCTATHDVTVSARVKNLATLQEKLRRLDGGLSTIRDIVGGRVVVVGDRFAQVELLLAIFEHFKNDAPRLIDRFSEPRCGYRALHVQIKRDGVRAEIQIRTHLQHEWAIAMEEFSGRAGRQARYTENYDFPELSGLMRDKAIGCLVALMKWSDEIDRIERSGYPEGMRRFVEIAQQDFYSRLGEFDAGL